MNTALPSNREQARERTLALQNRLARAERTIRAHETEIASLKAERIEAQQLLRAYKIGLDALGEAYLKEKNGG